MSRIALAAKIATLFLVMCVYGAAVSVARRPPPILNPKVYSSPSGEFQLEVDPSTMHGQGEGIYRLMRRGKEVWSGKHPFTLWEAGVTDGGLVAGYAYTHGWRGFLTRRVRQQVGGFSRHGHFHVVIFDQEGGLRLDDVIKRKRNQFPHSPPNPLAHGMFVDSDNDRLVVRIAGKDVHEVWWVYRLSDGKRLDDIYPKKAVRDTGPSWHEFDARPVRGTPLTLVHWWIWEGCPGGRFALLDLDGRPVWMHDLPEDYDIGNDRYAEGCLREYVRENSAILSCDENRRFEIWHISEKERVTFAVSPSPGSGGAWEVEQVASKPYVGREVVDRAEPDFPSIDLTEIGSITLGGETTKATAIRKVRVFDFDSQGHIGFPCADDDGSCKFVLVEPSGKVVKEVVVARSDIVKRRRYEVAWLGGERWVVIEPMGGGNPVNRLWWIDTNDATAQEFDAFKCRPAIKQVVGDRRGGFVVLTSGEFDEDGVIAFDGDGRRRWRVGRKHSGSDIMQSPNDITVLSQGHIAVSSGFTDLVQVFDASGKYVRTLDLKRIFGRRPGSLTRISADVDGGLIIGNFADARPFWRISADGAVRLKFHPRHWDGRTFPFRFGVRVAPDGSLWTCDGTSLLRLLENGVVDRVLGEPPDSTELGEVQAMAVDHLGRIYAVSRRTGAVHVFASDGEFQHVCKPLPSDFPNNMMDADVTVAGNGDVFVSGLGSVRGYVRFNADGERVGVETLADGRVGGAWRFKPNSQERWVTGLQELYLVDKDGEYTRTIERRPNRHWLENVHGIGIAKDGLAAVGSYDSRDFATKPAVSLFGPNGEPVRTIPLPFDAYIHRIAYNGDWVVLSREADLVILDSRGKSIRRFAPKTTRDKPYWQPFFSPDGGELWLCEQGSRTIRRFALPPVDQATLGETGGADQ